MELVVGRIVRAHGIHGEVVVEPRTDNPDARFAPGSTLRTDPAGPRGGQRLTVRAARGHQGRLLVRFAELAERSAAEGWRGALLVVGVPDGQPSADPDEFYDQQLAGLDVVTVDGQPVGVVAAVLHLPGQDILDVRAGDGQILIPLVTAIVPEIDIAGGRILVDAPPGLLEASP